MNIGDLFRKKSIERIKADAEAGFSDAENLTGEPTLRRSLGTFDLTMLGIAAIIGAGIFAMVGNAANKGGPAVILLFIFAAIACGFAALCYAEFASKIPIAGSAYTYAYASFGELLAWVIGWDLLVEYAIGNIAVAISWSDYFTRLLTANGIGIPAYFTMDYLSAYRGFTDNKEVVEGILTQGQTLEALGKMTGDQLAVVSDKLNPSIIEAYTAWTTAPHIGNLPVILDLPALGIVVLITALVYVGIRESKTASNIMVALKLAVILLVIFVGAFYVRTENWNPFMPNGFTGVMSGVAAVFFAYIGFDALSTTAEECKDPYKTLPRGMIYSLLICTVLYVILALVLTGMVSYTKLAVGDPLAFVFGPEGVNIPWISGVIAVSAIIAIATVLLVFQLGQPRLWMAMSRDGLLPKIFSSIHPKFRTPWFSTIMTGFMVAIPALFMNLSEVTDLSVIGTLFAFTIVCAGVLVKDKEFAGKKRFVPYISSQFIAPVLFVVMIFLVTYGIGVSALDGKYKAINEGTATAQPSEQEKTEAKNFSPYSLANLSNSKVYSAGIGSVTHFFTDMTPDPEKKDETSFDVFKHKIPYFIFFIFSIFMVILCFVKRLSLIPVLGVMCCTYLMTELGWTNWYRFAIWMMVGIRIYRLFSYKNSKLNPERHIPSGINILNVASIIADIILFGFILIPILSGIIGVSLGGFWLNLIEGIVIAVALELITQRMERK